MAMEEYRLDEEITIFIDTDTMSEEEIMQCDSEDQ